MRAPGPALLALALALAAAAAGSLLPLDAERLHASVGGYAVMNCHLDFPFGTEIPYHLQWEKDGEVILSWYSGEGAAGARVADRWGGRLRRLADGRLGLGRGSLNVTAVRETDAGLYRCRVSFPNRTPPERNNGTFYRLDVDGGNLILTPPMNVTVLEGEPAELECLPKDAEAAVQWYRGETPLEELPELAARSERPRNGSLLLRRALSADPAQYTCRVRDPHGHTQSASAFLDVQYKAKVVYAPSERYLPYGKPASLDCHFSANPPLTNLRWEKDGFLFDPYNVPGVFYSRNGSLLFNQVDASHEGSYSCTPYNALGTAGASPGVRVRVQQAPALAVRPQPLYVARLGERLTLPCAAARRPPAPAPAVSWARRDGRPLAPARHSVRGGNLTIAALEEADRGVYVCTARNDAAAVSAEADVRVDNLPPRAPHGLRARAAARSLHLSWAPGHSGQEVEYQVWFRERAVTEWRTMKILSRDVTEATLPGLRPATDYELRVLAQDNLGDGLFSKPLFVTTLDAEAEEGVTAFAAAATEPSADEDGADSAAELAVSVRLLDEGALVRWRRAPADTAPCTLTWLRDQRALHTAHTLRDYELVGEVEEGARYEARVVCALGAGGARLAVPSWSRRRALAGGCAAAALLLAAATAALLLARRRRRKRAR